MAHYCVQILKPSKLWLNFSNLCKSTLHLMKPTTNMWSMASQNPNPKSWSPLEFSRALTCRNKLWKIPMRHLRFMTFRSSSSYTRRHDSLLVHRSTWPKNLVVNRYCTRLHAPPGFLTSPSRTLLDDVITPRQQPRKHVYVSPSPCH